MSTTSDTSDATAMPAAAVGAVRPQSPPSPDAQHAEPGVHVEGSTRAPSVAASPVSTASATGATAVGPGIPPSPVPLPPLGDGHRDPRTSPRTPNPSAVALPAPTAATIGAAASPATAPAPRSQDEDELPIPEPKYLDPEWVKTGVPDTKFYKDYPLDQWGQEAAPNARVWKIYREEMTRIDTETLESWNGTLDVLLIFAGLFSAVSTAFIIESYKSLQPDYAQYMANFLYEAAGSKLAVDGVLMLPTAPSMGPPDRFVNPSATQRWTNGLWFTSLATSLTVALLCIMIKQWLDQYGARMKRSVPSMQGWARRHQIYNPGLSSWGVPTLISLLPLLLHVSLFLFFAGLVLFLRPLDGVIANALLTILMITLLFYLLSLVIPAFYIDCPSYTPLLAQARSPITFSLGLLARLSGSLASQFPPCPRTTDATMNQCIRHKISLADRALTKLLARSKQRFARETSIIEGRKFILDGRALNTLLVATNDPDIIDAGVEAVGAISVESTLEVVNREGPLGVIGDRTRQALLSTGDAPSAFAVLTNARRLRTIYALPTLRGIEKYIDRKVSDFEGTLGLDGAMLQVTVSNSHRNLLNAERRLYRGLLPHVTRLTEAQADGPSSPVPHRQLPPGLNSATCRLFLGFKSIPSAHVSKHIPCRLLAFCAGDFANAEPNERVSGIRHLLAFLKRASPTEEPTGNAPTGDADADDAARDALGRLLNTLVTLQECLDDADVARPFMHHLGLLSESLYKHFLRGDVPREQLAGFASFTQLPSFAKNISSLGLHAFIQVLKRSDTPSGEDAELLQQYWTSFTTLLKLQPNLGQTMDEFLSSKLRAFLNDPGRVITVYWDASDTVLLRFIQGVTALDARMGITVDELLCLLYLLCRRLRTQPIADQIVQSLFTGMFLTRQFRGLVTSDPDEGLWFGERRMRIMNVAMHCARLSDRLPAGSLASEADTSPRPLNAMWRICDELENPSNFDALGDDALALVANIRRGLEPDGELCGECDPWCDCWPQPEPQPPAEPTSRITQWRNRIRRRISYSPERAVELTDLASVV